MEIVKDQEIDQNEIEVFENDIYMYLKLFQEEKNIDSINRESQGVWNAALLYIYRHVFKGTDKLIINDTSGYKEIEVNKLCDLYISMCYENDKEVSILGFSKLTGVNPETIYAWSNEEYRPGSSLPKIYKKLNREREESLAGMLTSGKRNPVGVLGVLNHSYNWNMPGVREQREQKPQNLEQIKEKYITDGTAAAPQIEPPKADF